MNFIPYMVIPFSCVVEFVLTAIAILMWARIFYLLREVRLINKMAQEANQQLLDEVSKTEELLQRAIFPESTVSNLLDHYQGAPGTERRQKMDAVFDPLPGNKMSRVLNTLHTHAEIVYGQNPDQIVYREADIVELLGRMGFPVEYNDGIKIK